jgi:hypothetical protein
MSMPRQAPTPGSNNQRREHAHSCYGKVKHRTMEAAARALTETSAKYPDTLLQIYSCLHCGFLHLGNEMSKEDARRGLKKLDGQMGHANFWLKAPKEVIDHFQSVRQKCQKRLGLPVLPMTPVE